MMGLIVLGLVFLAMLLLMVFVTSEVDDETFRGRKR